MRVYEGDFTIDYKGPDDPVTTADEEANRLICDQLSRRFPTIPIVAEESDPASYGDYTNAERVWFVDPIDGTKEFIAKTGEFVVMIGLAERGEATAGIVYAPVQQTAWLGSKGGGAHVVRGDEVHRIAVSATSALEQSTLLASHPKDDADGERVARALGVGKVQSVGSAGLKGAMVAEGSADLYVSPGRAGKRWDACAIDALLGAAGGTLTDTYGHRLDYRRRDLSNDAGLLATNARLLPSIVEQLSRVRAQYEADPTEQQSKDAY